MKTIIVTGGGSGGHIAPIRAIVPELSQTKKICWIGSSHFERNSAKDLNIEFKHICSGKLRRYFSFKNITDIVRVQIGFFQSLFFMIKHRPEKIFSTGGFVSVPVVLAGWLLHIPIIIHEQSIGFGLANKIGGFCATKILLAFPESKKYIPKKWHDKIEVVGNPIRADLLKGKLSQLEDFLGQKLDNNKTLLYITGGGQGSILINNVVFENIDYLSQHYYVIHQTGKNGIVEAQSIKCDDYFPYEFINQELADIYTCADIVVARSGAGTVNELAFFGIYSIFIPLQPTQDDEQMKNAEWFLKENLGQIIHQGSFNKNSFLKNLDKITISELRRDIGLKNTEDDSLKLLLKNFKEYHRTL